MTYPDMAVVKQKLYSSGINDISAAVLSALSAFTISEMVKPGKTVAVAVGSRGINRIDSVVYHSLTFLKNKGLKPFIVPAMGSHGGATAKGQRDVLAKLGITESTMGTPICSEMDVVQVGKLSNGLKIFFSKKALEADHIVVINRIKPHTKFRAEIESGLCKMLTIGLGKAQGATEFHRCAVQHTFKVIEDAATFIINQGRILVGLALLEDGRGDLAYIEAILPSSIVERDKILLKEARATMGRIPFDYLDLFLVDFIKNDFMEIGMDSNITGRHRDIVGDFSISPHVKRIFARDLSPASNGNGNGIGLADITTKRLVDSLDIQKTYINALTAISPEKAAIPIYFDTDRKSLDVCARTIGLDSMAKARIVRIKDTASLELLQISKALKLEVLSNPDLELITPWQPFEFDEDDNLMEFKNPNKTIRNTLAF